MELILFDDAAARAWQPFALTRPAGELRFGMHRFRSRAERFAGVRCTGHFAGPALSSFDEPGAARGLDPAACLDPSRSPRLFLSARAVPAGSARFTPPARSGVVRIGERAAGWYAAPGDPPPRAELLTDPDGAAASLPTSCSAEGRLLDHVWQLVTESPGQVARDFEDATSLPGVSSGPLPNGVHVLGDVSRLHIAPSAQIEPAVVIDVRNGPVWIGEDVSVRAFTRLAGPSAIARGSTLAGGVLDAVSIGPVCRVHGEVEETVFLGHSNKAHDGFLGHAYVGSWVNLGALTTNSDLKNNYTPVRIWTPNGDVDTGLLKLGCLIGDHAKTGIGVMLNTGSVIGAGSNLFGAAQPPRYVAPFSWGSGERLERYRLDRFIEVAERVMARRKVALTSGVRAALETAWRSAQGA